jgi:hypothetical protein
LARQAEKQREGFSPGFNIRTKRRNINTDDKDQRNKRDG